MFHYDKNISFFSVPESNDNSQCQNRFPNLLKDDFSDDVFAIDTSTYHYDGVFATFNIRYPFLCRLSNNAVQLEIRDTSNSSLSMSYQVICCNSSYQQDCCFVNLTSSDVISTNNKILELRLNDSMKCENRSKQPFAISFESKLLSLLNIRNSNPLNEMSV